MSQDKKRVIYYSDPLNDDFSSIGVKEVVIDEKFKYVHKNLFWRFWSWFLTYFIAAPFVLFYVKVLKHVKFEYEDKKAFKKVNKKPIFIYGNHTEMFVDAMSPFIFSLPRRNKLLAGATAFSLKGLKNLVQLVGALPVPNKISGTRKFMEAIDWYFEHGYNISIYPEAHAWPYYNKIRPFKNSSFMYPVKHNAPCIAITTTYLPPKKANKKPRAVIHISKPFYPDITLSRKEAQTKLRDEIYNKMVETTRQFNSYEYIKYVDINSDKK